MLIGTSSQLKSELLSRTQFAIKNMESPTLGAPKSGQLSPLQQHGDDVFSSLSDPL